jgi:hypothetical protein
MARPISSLESHPQRQRIIDAIVAGRPYREIAAWSSPAVTTAAISRFKSRAIAVTDQAVIAAKAAFANNDKQLQGADTKAVTRAALAVAVDPFVAALVKKDSRRERWIADAEAKPDGMDHRALAAYDRNGTVDLELHARLTGRLEQTGPNIAIQIVCPAPELPDEPAGEVIDILPGK